ncbi:MFS transporter [Bifidobacterium margollesii]|uniref:MFS transporter n=1 Tax=Bifidobacterium margollesii TaxID=2020964 RepID=A0A2N5J9L4_9BIFI|nr:MFS transporter [Bifidobacterium margollesii]PLS30861.1 MFS transporter [Bifidobacterium margollesii]
MSTSIPVTQQIDNHPLTRNQRSLIGLAIVGNISEFFDMFLIGFVIELLMKDQSWQLTGFQSGIVLAGAGVGTVIGSILWGRLADRFGRKHAYVWCIIVLIVFTAASLFTPNDGWLFLTVMRIGVGIGVGGLSITSIPFVQEFVPAKQRGLLSGLTAVFIPLGIFLGGLATRTLGGAIGWRGLMALGCIPIILVIWAHFVPESPRYLQSQGRTEEARKAYAWAMQIPVEEVGELPIVEHTKNASYSLILKKYPKSLAIVTIGSFCFIAGSFTVQSWGQAILGQSFKFDTATVSTLFMVVSLGDLLGRLGSAWISDRIGRRWTMFICGVVGGIGCLIAAFAAHNAAGASSLHSAGMLFYVGIFIVMTFGDGAFGVLNPFGGEQFPNEARSTGLGLGYGIGATAKIFGPFVVGMLIGGGSPTAEVVFMPFCVFAGLLFLGAITYMFAKETAKKELEEI